MCSYAVLRPAGLSSTRLCSRDGRIPPVAVVATLAGCRPVREYALAVADGFADRRARVLHLRPDSADPRLRRLAARDVHLIEELRLLAELVHHRAYLRRNRIDGELEGKAERIVGGRLQHRDDLAGIDEGEAPTEEVDTSTSRTRARKLKIERLDAFLREAGPDITQRVIARRLTLKRRWAGGVRRAAHVRKAAVHLGGDVGPGGPGAREIGHSQYSRPGSGRAKSGRA